MGGQGRAGRELLSEAYDQLTGLVDALHRFRAAALAEIDSCADNANLVRLLRLQLRRVEGLLAYLEDEADVQLRDVLDRMHVIGEARQGRFN